MMSPVGFMSGMVGNISDILNLATDRPIFYCLDTYKPFGKTRTCICDIPESQPHESHHCPYCGRIFK